MTEVISFLQRNPICKDAFLIMSRRHLLICLSDYEPGVLVAKTGKAGEAVASGDSAAAVAFDDAGAGVVVRTAAGGVSVIVSTRKRTVSRMACNSPLLVSMALMGSLKT